MATTIFRLVKKPAKGYIPGAVLADLHKELSEPDSEFAFTVPTKCESKFCPSVYMRSFQIPASGST